MSLSKQQIRTADLLVELLVNQGIRHIYGVPGESYLPVLDALHDRQSDIEFITCRQEGGAAMAAEANGKLTGNPGICFVTRGPGATNASAGVHVAFQDSTPMVLFVGQVGSDMLDREAFQEIDYVQMFSAVAKWVVQINDASRLQEYVVRALKTAVSGRPGPVVVALPENILYQCVPRLPRPNKIRAPALQASAETISAVAEHLNSARKPMLIIGAAAWTRKARTLCESWLDQHPISIIASFRAQSLVDNAHSCFIGHLSVASADYLKKAISESDLIVTVGARLGEITTAGYTLIKAPVPEQKLIHVYPEASELGRVYEPALSLVSSPESFFEALASSEMSLNPESTAHVKALRQEFESYRSAESLPGDQLAPMFDHINRSVPNDVIFTNGAGNYAAWCHRLLQYRSYKSQLAPTSGSMGYGLPAAVAAATASPERKVIAFAGDGCFMMTCQELATAMQYRLNILLIIVNNGRYGTIRAHQEREFPDRVSGTDMINPDFCKLGVSFGAQSTTVSTLDSFSEAFDQALSHDGLSLIEITQDPAVLAPGVSL